MGNRDSWTQAPQHCVPVPVSRCHVRCSSEHDNGTASLVIIKYSLGEEDARAVRERRAGAPPRSTTVRFQNPA